MPAGGSLLPGCDGSELGGYRCGRGLPVEHGHDQNCHEDLAILVDSQVRDPCLVGKLGNVAGGESCASMGMGGC